MVPTLLFVGLPFGLVGIGRTRWWIVLVAALGWPMLLVLAGVDSGLGFALAAGVVGAANTAAGVVLGVVLSTSGRVAGSRAPGR